MDVFGDDDGDEDDNTPVKPLRPKVAGVSVLGNDDDDEEDDAGAGNVKRPSPAKPQATANAAKANDSKNDDEDEGGGDFKNRLAAMLMKGPPSQAPRRTQAVPQGNHMAPEDLFE